MASSAHPPLTLHTFYRSSCSARVRTACAHKSIPLNYIFHDLPSNAHLSPSYKKINPSTSVPTLIFPYPTPGNSDREVCIRQSVAILEYLEEAFPDRPRLLPGLENVDGLIKRARVREMMNVVVADVQPATNQASLRRVESIVADANGNSQAGEAGKKWAQEVTRKGLKALNEMITEYGEGGKYCIGDDVTLADICLAPAVEQAFRWEIDIQAELGEVWRVYQNVKDLEAFKAGDWRHQMDTPEELREV